MNSAVRSSKSKFREILSKSSQTIIKPASPTSGILKCYNLSTRDVHTPDIYMPIVLFFPNPYSRNHHQFTKTHTQNDNDISYRLKHSLAKTLTQFYPFAGRLSSGSHVDCNDEGVEFREARVKCQMSEILHEKTALQDDDGEDDSLGFLFPPGSVWDERSKYGTATTSTNSNGTSNSSPLLLVQLNHFDCGGIAMAVSISHRITDGGGLCTFLRHWAAVSSGDYSPVHHPHFISWQSDDSVVASEFYFPKKHWVTKRFVFGNSSLSTLKAMVAKQGVKNPTRVEVLTALIYKSAMAAATARSSKGFTPSVLIQPTDMRSKLRDVPETTVGNFYWPYLIPVRDEREATLHGLNEQIKKGKMELRDLKLKDMEGKELGLKAVKYIKENYKIYIGSSLCNFPLNKVDFGWGRPIKMSIADCGSNNVIYFVDTPSGDGIEAMVSLDEQEMVNFQSDEQILNFCSC